MRRGVDLSVDAFLVSGYPSLTHFSSRRFIIKFNECPHCHNSGLVHVLKIETEDKYVFACSCIFGSKGSVFPVWKNPTKGFVVEEVEFPKPQDISALASSEPVKIHSRASVDIPQPELVHEVLDVFGGGITKITVNRSEPELTIKEKDPFDD
jgi:hypothetical protein